MIIASGIGSGLDIDGLVRQLVTAERAPAENRLRARETRLTAQFSALGSLSADLTAVRTSLAGFRSANPFQQQAVSSSNGSVLTATASAQAAAASYQVRVDALATSQSLATAVFAAADTVVGEGTLTLRFGSMVVSGSPDGTQSIDAFTPNSERSEAVITIGPGNNTIAGVRDAINQAGIGLRASLVGDGGGVRLLINGGTTGAANALEIVVSDADGDNGDGAGLSQLSFTQGAANLQQTAAAQNASFRVDGLLLSSASNQIDNVIEGVSLSLRSIGSEPVTLSVSANRAPVLAAVRQFVAAYNAFIGNAAKATQFAPSTKVAGPLQGDFSVRSIVNQLRGTVTGFEPSGTGAIRALAQLGITSSVADALQIDEAAFQAALDSQPAAVEQFFLGPTGLATRLDGFLNGFLATDGVLPGRLSSVQASIDRLGNDREALSRRLESLEGRVRARFNALDGLLANLNTTSNFVQSQLANLQVPGTRNRN
jgi:flagellar hook-associated protein 2